MHAESQHPRRAEAGLSIVEFLLAAFLVLIVAIGVYSVIDWARRTYVKQTDTADTQSNGRVALDLMATDVLAAGYSPLGASFNAVEAASATSIRIKIDRDGDGIVGTTTDPADDTTYAFTGPNAQGLYTLVRGSDLNGDDDFTDTGESVQTVITRVVQIDYNGDGTLEPFLSVDQAAPKTTRVTVTFGARSENIDLNRQVFPVSRFQSDLTLRNKLLG